MANFNPPFSTGADMRYPTTDERNNGFECGPADRQLFNGLYHRLESEVGAVITAAGLTQTDADLTQLLQAIQALIDAATGGGAVENYLLVTQARARLPIYPEVLTAGGTITCTVPEAGKIRVPGGVNFMHRGIFPLVTTQTDFTTEASNTYHIRWTMADGLVIKKLTDPAYNPSALVETNPVFDSTYDDMLIARVITNSANVATINNLANKQRLVHIINRDYLQYPPGSLATPATNAASYEAISYNLARTPFFMLSSVETSGLIPTSGRDAEEWNISAQSLTRYGATMFTFQWDSSLVQGGRPRYTAAFNCIQ